MRRALVLAVGALAGCATGVPVERQVVVAGGNFANVQGEADFVVRTFLEPVGDERREVLGARCQAVSSLYTAELVTPARLVVPNFGPQSPEIDVSCTADGLTGTGRATIVTTWNQAPGYWGPPYGVGPYPYWGGGWGWGPGWGGPAIPVSNYRELNVVLR